MPDGPGRVRLPGFGAATWRAVAILREGGGDPAAARWAAAVAHEPAADLGAAAPAFLRDLPPPGALAAPARRLLAADAERQDLRDALLRAGPAAAAARARGHEAAAAAVERDCARIEGWIAELDRRAAARWDEGLRLAADAPRPVRPAAP
ncbi:hypothetical protein [Miltoncostaea marina]|uniref:hypothetical protein n=1 Tax=Miltoncostaea marina TaxID=2843215 RepID=UPI001C3D05FE|nr:hypothetical protein [Miltoncostaea marina]